GTVGPHPRQCATLHRGWTRPRSGREASASVPRHGRRYRERNDTRGRGSPVRVRLRDEDRGRGNRPRLAPGKAHRDPARWLSRGRLRAGARNDGHGPPPSKGGGMKILVADDDKTLREELAALLRE